MRYFNIIRALVVRMFFAIHGVMALWRLHVVTGRSWSWYMSGTLVGLIIETLITLLKKEGKEWKWFCPSVFFYLSSVVPAIWLLELHAMTTRINIRLGGNATVAKAADISDLTAKLDSIGLDLNIPVHLSNELWLRIIEQVLLLMLILGRWMLPKGALSHDQLSQLLLVYVGTAADIVEFFEAFNEEEVQYNPLLCYIVLGIWTLSLVQFCLVLTATRGRRDQSGLPSSEPADSPLTYGCCNPELYGIVTSIFLQDAPFLVVRMLLIFKFQVVSYTNMFFTFKNTLVILLLLYRIIVIRLRTLKRLKAAKEASRGQEETYRPRDSLLESKIRLIYKTTPQCSPQRLSNGGEKVPLATVF